MLTGLRVALLTLAALSVCTAPGCAKRSPIDLEALSNASTMLIVSHQGPRLVRITLTAESSAWGSSSSLPFDDALRTLDGANNHAGAALVDASYPLARRSLSDLLHLLDAGDEPLAEVGDQLPAAGAHSIFKLNHHAAPPTKLMMRGGDTPQRLGKVAAATGADLAVWAEVSCSIRDTEAEATFSVIMAAPTGRRVAWGSGVGTVTATETLTSSEEDAPRDAEGVVVAICRPAVERAIARVAAKFLGNR